MRPEIVFLFPGQGGYVPGSLARLTGTAPAVREQLDVIDSVCGEHGFAPVSPLLTEPASPSLADLVRDRSEQLDLVLFAGAVANHEVLGGLGVVPDVVLGHSFGELAALTAAGAFTVADATRLACERTRALRRTPPLPGGMVALTVDARRAAHLAGYADGRGLVVAVENGPDQCVVSGPEPSLAELERVARALGVAATRLPTAYPFHNPLLRGHVGTLEAIARAASPALPRIPVYSCVLGRYVETVDDVASLLDAHLTRPVRFYDGLLRVHRDGGRSFVEVGSLDILAPLARRCLPPRTTILTAPKDHRTVADVAEELRKAGVPVDTTVDAAVPVQAGPVEPAPAEVVPEPRPDPGSRARLLDELRSIYADLLGVPEELLGDDIDLEADLGIDSIKQVESFSQLRRRYHLGELPDDVRITSFTTLPKIADLVLDLGDRRVPA